MATYPKYHIGIAYVARSEAFAFMKANKIPRVPNDPRTGHRNTKPNSEAEQVIRHKGRCYAMVGNLITLYSEELVQLMKDRTNLVNRVYKVDEIIEG
jgi:DNA primase large subunit